MAAATLRRRTHVVLPDELLHELDARVGPRRRSEFIRQAIEEKLNQLRRVEAFEQVVGSNGDWETPEWETPERAIEWVRSLRQEWESRTACGEAIS
jgi:Arc/MetJ-type ribon-helix-helix transcriptional regulator